MPLDPEPTPGLTGYGYDYEWIIGPVAKYGTAANAMNMFASNPGAIFPFPVSGCTSLSQGATCKLTALGDLPSSVGMVAVSRAPTAVRFTVVSNEYFDNAGSTITFRIVERAGNLVLQQQARSTGLKLLQLIGRSFVYLGAAAQWREQALNLRSALDGWRAPGSRSLV